MTASTTTQVLCSCFIYSFLFFAVFLWLRYSATNRPGIYTTAFSLVLCEYVWTHIYIFFLTKRSCLQKRFLKRMRFRLCGCSLCIAHVFFPPLASLLLNGTLQSDNFHYPLQGYIDGWGSYIFIMLGLICRYWL